MRAVLLLAKYNICCLDFGTHSLGNTLSNDSNALDLGALHQLHGGAVDGTGRGEVDNSVNIRVLGHGLADILVDREQGLAGAPVPVDASISSSMGIGIGIAIHLAHELATEGVDDTGDGRSGTLADEVEVKHTLNSPGLHTTVILVNQSN